MRWLLLTVVCCAASVRADEATPEPFAVVGANNVRLAVTHILSRDDARARVMQLLDYWATRFGVKSEWRGFKVFLSGTVWGVEIRALFHVDEHVVYALAQDPGSALTGTAKDYVSKKLKKYLHPTYDP